MADDTSTSIDILFVTALEEELCALTESLTFNSQPVFLTSSIPCYINHQAFHIEDGEYLSAAVICLNEMGNVDAGIDVSHALRDLNPLYVFMFGIAGGFKDEVALTDVVVPEMIFYSELGKQHSDRTDIRPKSLRIGTDLLQKLRAYSFMRSNSNTYQVRFGPLAVGEKIIASSEEAAVLRRIHPKMIGVDMESYGFGLAAHKLNIDFATVRGISDHADEHKSDGFRLQALRNAADFLIGFMRSGLLIKKPRNLQSLPKFIAINHLSLNRRPSVSHAVRQYLTRLQQYEIIELPLYQVDLYDRDRASLVNPGEALHRQQEMLARFYETLDKYPAYTIGYFGLAHIPLMFHMGYEIYRTEVDVFANDYESGEWLDLPERSRPANIVPVEGFPGSPIQQSGDVILLMSVSYEIKSSDPDSVVEQPLGRIHIRAMKPRPGLIDSQELVNRFAQEFRETLYKINSHFPNARRIHLFFAGPPTLAFRCGQQINRNIDREILVYNYSRQEQPNYRWAISLQSNEIIERKR